MLSWTAVYLHSANSFCLHLFLLRNQHGPKLIDGRHNSWHVISSIDSLNSILFTCLIVLYVGWDSGGWVSGRVTGCFLLELSDVEMQVLMFQLCGSTFNWIWALRVSAILPHSCIRFAIWCVAWCCTTVDGCSLLVEIVVFWQV